MRYSIPIKTIVLSLIFVGHMAVSPGQSKAPGYDRLLTLIENHQYEEAFTRLGNLEKQYAVITPDKNYVQLLLEVIYLLNRQGAYEPALTYSFYLLKVCEGQDSFAEQETECLLEIGSSYYFLGLPSLSLDYTMRALELAQQHTFRKQIAAATNKVGLYYMKTGDYKSAIAEFEKSLQLRENINDVHGQSATLGNLGMVYQQLGRYQEALQVQLRSMALDASIPDTLGVAWSHQMLGSLAIKMGDYVKAGKYLDSAAFQAARIKSNELLLRTYRDQKELYEKLGNFEKALEYASLFESLQDSIHDRAVLGRATLLQNSYELNRTNSEIAAHKITLTWQRNFMLLGIVVAFIISILASFYYRSFRAVKALNRDIAERNEEILQQSEHLKKANADLEKLNLETAEQKEEIQAQAEELTESHATIVKINEHLEETVAARTTELGQAYKELDTFFYRASHDFRRPLTTFMGLSEVAKITVKDPYALELFEKVRQTANNLDKMLMKLQSISDVGLQQLSYKEVFAQDIFNIIFTSYGEDFRNAEISFKTDASIASFYSYPTIIKVILENLVENAIQFRRITDSFVKVAIAEEDHEIVLAVSDNGQGIAAQYHEQIFNMYFRGSENSKGNGLGLYIVKKATEKLKGRIVFESVFNEGSTFKIILPNGIT